MNKSRLLLSLGILMFFLAGCAKLDSIKSFRPFKSIGPVAPFTPYDLDSEYRTGKYIPKVDNFIIILDASSSMDIAYKGEVNKGHSKFVVAKDLVSRMNNTMPEMDIKGALVTFGNPILKPLKKSEIVYGPTTYTRAGLGDALNLIGSAKGNSPAGTALKDTNYILETTQGRNAVILVSDGEKLINEPLMKVRELKRMFGDRTCFYSVWVGNNLKGKEYLNKLAREMRCGFTTDADSIASSDNMANFVKKVFLDDGGAQDSDGDGVYDHLDKCPGTPKGVEVDEFGCPKITDTGDYSDYDDDGYEDDVKIDSDGDGVYDDQDQCPNTPRGAIVDFRGCWVVKGVKFDYKKWNIKPEFNSNLNNIVTVLKNNPGLKVRIEGHTDNIGSEKYNLDLSQKRANAVKNYLVGRGINSLRITTAGFGFSRPIDTNETSEGRALNRRAELIPLD